ncbi:hypothetical protein D0T84_20910 [Dysgonomonas sp. 521]|uniref:BatD family protein n=1 Tax=Dysgonomonas sp. 521 TaxID=2302932 RepID=UPI0013D7B410|nr:BatD family protein [Dysgonomonas sp. 521]NDV97340.1 hypothetical protein [Dysgonomonas sp. 521]
MKKILPILVMMIISTIAYGQEITIEIERDDYQVGEQFNLTYKVNSKIDSVGKMEETNFIVLKREEEKGSFSRSFDHKAYYHNITYQIKAYIPGTLEIYSPVFYIEGQELKAEPLTLTITGKMPTDEEIDEINFKKIMIRSKPDGTLLYILSGDFGYVGEYKNALLEFKRKMTKDEIEEFRKKE